MDIPIFSVRVPILVSRRSVCGSAREISRAWSKPQEISLPFSNRLSHSPSQNAELSLANAHLSYDKLFTNVTEAEKIQAKNTLIESQSSLNLLETQYSNLLTEQKNTVLENEDNIKLLESKAKLAESDLEYTKKNITTDTTSNNLERDITSANIQLEDTLRSIEDIRKYYYDTMLLADRSNSRYGDLGGQDETNKRLAEQLFTEWSGSINALKANMVTLRSETTPNFTETLRVLEEAKTLLTDGSRLSSSLIIELDTTNRWTYYNTDNMTTTMSTVKTHASTINSKLSAINSALTTLKNYGNDELEALADKNTITQKEQSLEDAQNTLAKAKRNLETLKKTQDTNRISSQDEITRMKNSILLNEKKYQELINGPTREERASAENAIQSANISLQKANLTKKDYQIIATFDGVVEDIPWRVWDTTLTTEGILVSNKDSYEISLSLDQIDIVKVRLWMNARIILDAFPTETFTGVVGDVSETPTETSGVVSYTAKIHLIIPDKHIMSKMSATVTVILNERKGIIVIPSSMTLSEKGKTYVNIQSWWWTSSIPEKRAITLGISENGKVEVLSGLTLGERIQSTITTTTPSWAKSTGTISTASASSSKRTSTFWGPPGGF
jgi:multidrug efflux pump subunit AcrA (membrane-fusion protein)